MVENKIIVELKAVILLEDVHLAQALNYLKAYRMEVGRECSEFCVRVAEMFWKP